MSGEAVPDSAFCAWLSLPDRDRLNAAIMQVVDDCIVAMDEQGRVIEFNPAAEATFGWSRTAVLGRQLNQLIVPPCHRAAHEAGFARYLATGAKRMIGRRVETEAMRADGGIFPVEISIAEVPSSAGRLFAASLRDISERRRTEAKRSEELTQLNRLLDALPIGIFVKDRAGRYLIANLEARRLNETPGRSWIGLTDADLFRPELATRFRLADEKVWVNRRSQREEIVIDYVGVEQNFLSGKDIVAQADGQEVILGFIVDITARKAAEDEVALQREALHQAVKMSALGSILANVAHELNNPLSILLGHAIMLQEEIEPGTEIAEVVGRIHAAAERCARIIKTFLDMARQRPSQRSEVQAQPADPRHGRADGLRAAQQRHHGAPRARSRLAGARGRRRSIGAGAGQPDRQRPAGDARPAADAACCASRRTRATSGRTIELDGRATPAPASRPRSMKRMFEPFFTTKAPGSGTGLGMSVCRSIVEAHLGTIGAATGPAGGALIIVELPVAAKRSIRQPRREAIGGEPGGVGGGRRAGNRGHARARLLGRLGHSVDVALDGNAALERIRERRYDVILSDLHMPGLDGPNLWRRIASTIHGWRGACCSSPATP